MDETLNKKRKLAWWAITLIVLGSLVAALALTAGGYVIYVVAQYYRIPDNTVLAIENNKGEKVAIGEELTFTTYNAGFGAYSPDYTFFMDEGISPTGESEVGTYATARSLEETTYNIEGSAAFLKSLNSDFYAIQEVDHDSDRTYHMDQREMFKEKISGYASTYASNFHSAWLCYPFNDIIGSINSGLLTLSRYQIEESVRRSYPVSDSFPDKFFDLDRCFSVNRVPTVNGKDLVIANSHMSAYDEGGMIRSLQTNMLSTFLEEEQQKGSYVIVGGDFNHDLLLNNPAYDYTRSNLPFAEQFQQQMPKWVGFMFDENGDSPFPAGFSIQAADNVPTCRGADVVYNPGYNYVTTIDGFIVSDNVEVISVYNSKVSSGKGEMFSYSDHQPATLTFRLS